MIYLPKKKTIEEEEERENIINDDVLNVTYSIDYRSGLLEPAFSFIKKWGSIFIKDDTKRKIFYSSFYTFAINSNDYLNMQLINEKEYNWLHIRTIKNLGRKKILRTFYALFSVIPTIFSLFKKFTKKPSQNFEFFDRLFKTFKELNNFYICISTYYIIY